MDYGGHKISVPSVKNSFSDKLTHLKKSLENCLTVKNFCGSLLKHINLLGIWGKISLTPFELLERMRKRLRISCDIRSLIYNSEINLLTPLGILGQNRLAFKNS